MSVILTALRVVLVYLLNAVTGRVRGGWDLVPINGTFVARMVYCIPMGLQAWAYVPITLVGYGSMLIGASTGFMTYAGLMVPHKHGQDMGHMDDDFWKDFALMSAIGIVRLYMMLIPSCVYFSRPDLMYFAGAGVMHGVFYAIGWRVPFPEVWRGNNLRPVDAPTAWAELFWYGFTGVVLYYATFTMG